jgi:hypothetical protein
MGSAPKMGSDLNSRQTAFSNGPPLKKSGFSQALCEKKLVKSRCFVQHPARSIWPPKKKLKTGKDFYCGKMAKVLPSFLWIWKL